MKLSQMHLVYHPKTDSVILYHKAVIEGESSGVDITAEFVHALGRWGLAETIAKNVGYRKPLHALALFVKTKIFRRPETTVFFGRRKFTDNRGNSYNITVEHCIRNDKQLEQAGDNDPE